MRGLIVLVALTVSGACDGGGRPPATVQAGGVDVRCTGDGIDIKDGAVSASGDGVHLRVDNTTDDVVRLVLSPVQDNPTVTVPPGISTALVLAVPGEVELRCEPDRHAPPFPVGTIVGEDPGGFYRSVHIAEVLGCQPDAFVSLHDAAWGPTARAAADAYAAGLEGEVAVTEGNGYRDYDRKQFLVHVDGVGTGTLDVYPDRHPDGTTRFRASYGEVCSDRAFPD